VNISKLARTATALVAGAALFAAVSAGAFAVPPNTFTVSTTITASCSVTDAGPANLTPTYTPTTDTGVGSATTLDTFCTGTTPTVVLSDAAGSGGPEFVMTDGGANLYYHLANGTSCNGTNTDNVIDEGTAINLTGGEGVLNICAAVIAGGGLNVDAAAGSYLDTVTYTITP
jgi:spore coat protein U-like protein